MMMGQIAEQLGDVDAARDAFAKGLKQCPDSIPLWTLSADLEHKSGMPSEAVTK
jgi:pre-mRNA-processing factor 6